MKKNVGTSDKIIRIILGILIAAWGIFAPNWLGLISVALFTTAFIGVCPIYALLGLSTEKKVDVKKVKI